MIRKAPLAASLCLALVAWAGPACAQVDLFSPSTISGVLDLRLASVDGQRSWTDGGTGKLRYGSDGPRDMRLDLGEASLAWAPRFSQTLKAVVVAQAQGGQDPAMDIGEAYLAYRAAPGAAVRLSARAGLIYPPLSREHDGLEWTVPATITPSAINSWVAEEVKVAGLEATLRWDSRAGAFAGTAGLFGYGDSSGTLLTFRGWALHDIKSTATGQLPLPRLSPYMARRQAPQTTSLIELDHRIGAYGRLEWSPSERLSLDAFVYDNNGDLTSVRAQEWAWRTRFLNLGLRAELDDRTSLLAQAMTGETAMGFSNANGLWADVGFDAAYAMLVRQVGPGGLAGRLDYFTVSDRTNKAVDNNAEQGWALTAAYRWDIAPGRELVFEALHVESKRPARAIDGEPPRQSQTGLQAAYRLSF